MSDSEPPLEDTDAQPGRDGRARSNDPRTNRRGLMAAATVALATACFVLVATPNHRVPVAFVKLVSDARSTVDVVGGSRVELAVVGSDKSLEITQRVAAQLRERGAEVAAAWAGRIAIDVPRVSPEEVQQWTTGVDIFGSVELSIVVEDTAFMREVLANENTAREFGVRRNSETWRAQGQLFRDYFLESDSLEALESYLRELRSQGFAPPSNTRLLIQEIDGHSTHPNELLPFRTYVVSTAAPVSERDIEDATVSRNPISGFPEVVIRLSSTGQWEFGSLTAKNLGRKLAIIVDGRVTSAPIIEAAITGGQISITTSIESSVESAFVEAEGLAAALRIGRLETPLERISTQPVQAIVSAGAFTVARLLFALTFALLAFAMVFAIARWVPTTRSPILERRSRATSATYSRVLLTAGAMGAAVFAMYVPIPGVSSAALKSLGDGGIAGWTLGFGAFGLGFAPVFTAFVVVELAALALPPLRRLRTGGPATRAVLGRATAVLAVVIASLQAWFVVQFLAEPDLFGHALIENPGVLSELIVATSLVGFTFALVVLASLVSRHGLGNGYVAVLCGPLVYELYGLVVELPNAELRGGANTMLPLFILATVGLTVAALRARIGGASAWNRFHLPTCGLIPAFLMVGLAVGQSLIEVSFPSIWYLLNEFVASLVSGWRPLGISVLLAVALSLLFSRPTSFAKELPLAGKSSRASWRSFSIAAAISTLLIVVLVVLEDVTLDPFALYLPGLAPNLLSLALLTAGAMDAVADFRARSRCPDLVAVWSLHRVPLIDVATDALAQQGIESHVHGANVRKLFHFFAPFVPILIMVPKDQTEEATSALNALLADSGPLKAHARLTHARQ